MEITKQPLVQHNDAKYYADLNNQIYMASMRGDEGDVENAMQKYKARTHEKSMDRVKAPDEV